MTRPAPPSPRRQRPGRLRCTPASNGVHLSAAKARYLQAKVTHTAHTLALPLAG
jgi:hypothetical protein